MHFVGLFLSSLLKMHGPKNQILLGYFIFLKSRTIHRAHLLLRQLLILFNFFFSFYLCFRCTWLESQPGTGFSYNSPSLLSNSVHIRYTKVSYNTSLCNDTVSFALYFHFATKLITFSVQSDASLHQLRNHWFLENDILLSSSVFDSKCGCFTWNQSSPMNLWCLLVTWWTTNLTFNSCTFCTHCIYVFCIYLRTNSDLCHLQHKLIGFYNPDEKCLQRGTDWVFK